MRLPVILLTIMLMAFPVMADLATGQSDLDSIANDLDAFKFQVNDFSNKVESELTDLNVLDNSLSNGNATITSQPAEIKSLAKKADIRADGYERQLSGMEKNFWTIQSRYKPGNFSNKDATAIEMRMSAIQNQIDRTRSMIGDMRVSADRVGRRL